MSEWKISEDRAYDEYVWVKAKDGIAEVGITDYGLSVTKEIVFVDLPEAGGEIKKGDTFVTLESVKWSGHLSSPVSGEIIEVNDKLFDEPEILNKDPYENWICRIKLKDGSELDDLMTASEAESWAKENI